MEKAHPADELELLQAHVAHLEAKLAQYETRIAHLKQRALPFEQGEDAFVMMDAANRIVDWNPAATALLGYTRDEMLGQTPDVLYAPVFDIDPLPQHILASVHQNDRWQGGIFMLPKTGAAVFCEGIVRAVRDAQGTLVAMLGIYRDRRQAETERQTQQLMTELEEKSQLLEMVVSNTPNLFVVMDREGRYCYANRAALTALNCELSDILGKTRYDIGFPAAANQQFANDYASVLRTQKAITRQISLLTSKGLRDFVYSLNPVMDKAGDVALLVATISDITEQKQIEQVLRESEEKFRLLVEYAPEAIVITNLLGEIILVNAAAEAIFGYDRQQLEGQPIEILLPENSRPEHQQQRHNFANSPHLHPRNSNLDLFARHQDGTVFPVEVGLNILDIEGEQIAVSFIIDTSQRHQAERALRESEERYRTLFEQINDAIFVHDTAGNILDVNEATCRIFGYSRDELLHMKTVDLDAPECGARFADRLQLQLERGKLSEIEIMHITRDGRHIIHDVNTTIIQYKGQVAILSVSRDITERKQTEARLRAQNRHLLALQSAGGAISSSLELQQVLKSVVLEMTNLLEIEICTISEWNQSEGYVIKIARCSQGGWEADYTTAQPFYLADYPVMQQVLVERQIVQQTISQPDLAPSERTYMEQRGYKTSVMLPMIFKGQVIGLASLKDHHLERTFSPEEIALIQLLANQAASAIENARLYTQSQQELEERKRTEEALLQSQGRLNRVINFITDHVYAYRIDPDGTFADFFFSPKLAALFGCSSERALATDNLWLALVHSDDQPVMLSQMVRLVQGQNSETEYRILPEGGDLIWVRDSARVEGDDASQPRMIYGVISDITHRKQAESGILELALEKEKVQMLADFITSASHDFRTPISTLNTSIYLLGKVDDPDRRVYHLDVMYKQTTHLEKLVDALLTLSRLDSATDFPLKRLNPQEMVFDLQNKVQALTKDKPLLLTVTADADLPLIKANNTELHRALLYLIENAIVYTPEGGSITVTLARDTTDLVITVQDTGIGISQEDQRHIFDRFYRADKARSTETGGLGLGLSIARKIVELHGGRIEVESVLDEGSTFRVWLPGLPE